MGFVSTADAGQTIPPQCFKTSAQPCRSELA